MRDGEFLFTSESVSEGHPDKVSDRISDAVVDTYLAADPLSRVACETLTTTNRIVIAGEVRGPESRSLPKMVEDAARQAAREIGYEQDGFHWRNAKVDVHLHRQSADIALGVDAAGNKDEGAGDQGLMFGYACRETPALMPAAIHYSHEILRSLAEARHAGTANGLGPDSKSQVTLEYRDRAPVRATSVVVSTQHHEDLDQDAVREIVRPHVERVLPEGWMCGEDEFYVNPTGRFVIGGPDGDCGLTGRKIIVDTYGGSAPHGGGAFSGKDPSKVDRSAAYAARWVAKNVVRVRARRQVHHPDRLRHRRLEAAVGLRRYRRHLAGRGRPPFRNHTGGRRPLASRHPRAACAQPPDLRPHRGVRAFRTRTRRRRRFLVGKDGSRRRPQVRGRLIPRRGLAR